MDELAAQPTNRFLKPLPTLHPTPNQAAQIVTNQLGENFIPHSQFALAAH